jgi:hypothetical protein
MGEGLRIWSSAEKSPMLVGKTGYKDEEKFLCLSSEIPAVVLIFLCLLAQARRIEKVFHSRGLDTATLCIVPPHFVISKVVSNQATSSPCCGRLIVCLSNSGKCPPHMTDSRLDTGTIKRPIRPLVEVRKFPAGVAAPLTLGHFWDPSAMYRTTY